MKLPLVTKLKSGHVKLIFSMAAVISIYLLANAYIEKVTPTPAYIKYGLSFSPDYAKSLGLDWKKTYIQTLDELGVKNLRLPTYWQDVEPAPGKFDFTDADFLLNEAQKRGARVLMVVGIKQPRWPECQIPKWVQSLTLEDRRAKNLEAIRKIVERYKVRPEIWGWQVENEPLFQFGFHCDPPDENYLKEEVSLVKQIDPSRPIVITDTGEWRPWIIPMQLSDILGISLYRKAHNILLGDYAYPFPASMYIVKSNLVRQLFATSNKKTIITELQAEPWSGDSLLKTPIGKQIQLFSVDDLRWNVDFAKETRFDEIYLWGVEWWYWMKERDHPQYWNYAKTLF